MPFLQGSEILGRHLLKASKVSGSLSLVFSENSSGFCLVVHLDGTCTTFCVDWRGGWGQRAGERLWWPNGHLTYIPVPQLYSAGLGQLLELYLVPSQNEPNLNVSVSLNQSARVLWVSLFGLESTRWFFLAPGAALCEPRYWSQQEKFGVPSIGVTSKKWFSELGESG